MITKRLFLAAVMLQAGLMYGQKVDKNILRSTDIGQIEEFLKQAHPDDPRKIVLKKKLISLKNAAWTQGAKTAKPMAARLIDADPGFGIEIQEAEEFKKLMSETSSEHKEKTVNLLNNLFSNDIGKSESIVLVKNNSDCNIILRLKGSTEYNLGVPARGNNFIVVKRGNYLFQSKVCGNPYESKKNIDKNISLDLSSKGKFVNNTSGNVSNTNL